MAPVISPQERKKRIKFGIAVLLLSVPYAIWVAWASGTDRLPPPPLIGIIFILNFVIAFLILSFYRNHLLKSKD
jgi:hypothetical protein